ncbi:MAG: (2Fe-2S)-binding protein [Alphaproteobacteria bacterium]|nr:(2Fe-2S)-binding protein [Alphaproteobacteria bacterium]
MYVCLCNALKCRDVKAAAASGARDVPSVFKACGAKPKCGRCFEEAARFLTPEPAQAEPVAG